MLRGLLGQAYAAEEMVLEVEGEVGVVLDGFEDLRDLLARDGMLVV